MGGRIPPRGRPLELLRHRRLECVVACLVSRKGKVGAARRGHGRGVSRVGIRHVSGAGIVAIIGHHWSQVLGAGGRPILRWGKVLHRVHMGRREGAKRPTLGLYTRVCRALCSPISKANFAGRRQAVCRFREMRMVSAHGNVIRRPSPFWL